MKNNYYKLLYLSIFIFLIGCFSPKIEEITNRENSSISEQKRVSFCELIKNSESFDNKKVETSAILLLGFERAYLYDPQCVSQNNLVWFEIENQIEDHKLDSFIRPDSPEYRSKGVIRVKVIIEGEFYAKKKNGYGHLNSYNYMFKIETIKTITEVSRDVVYP